MEEQKILKKKAKEKIGVYLTLPKSASNFMKEKGYSPTAIMLESLKELGWKEEESKKEE